jgi:hypothetical protein
MASIGSRSAIVPVDEQLDHVRGEEGAPVILE